MQSAFRTLLRTPAIRSGLWMQQQQGMATGTVKWFNMARGFGFIVEDGADKESTSIDSSCILSHSLGHSFTHSFTHFCTSFTHNFN